MWKWSTCCHLFLLFCKFFDFFAPCCHQWIIVAPADAPSVPFVTFHFLLAVPGIELSLCFLVKSLQKGFHPCKSAPCHFSPLSQTDVFAFRSVSRVLYLGLHPVDRYSFRPKLHEAELSWSEHEARGGSSDSSVAVSSRCPLWQSQEGFICSQPGWRGNVITATKAL